MHGFVDQHPSSLALGFIVYLIALWLLIGLVVGTAGGWRSLAKNYRTTRSIPQKAMYVRSGSMRWGIGYHHVLTLASDVEGLYLGVFFLFRLGHPRLFIPWSDISIGRRGKRLLWSTQSLFLGPSGIPLTVHPNLVARLLSLRP